MCRLLERHGQGGAAELGLAEKEAAEIDIKYAGFVRRQERQLAQTEQRQSLQLPADLDYSSITTLRMEAREKLAKVQLLFHCWFQVVVSRLKGSGVSEV